MNLLWRPTSKALGRQKYNENATTSQCHNNDSAKRWVFSLVKKSVYVDEVRMCEGREAIPSGWCSNGKRTVWKPTVPTVKPTCKVDRLHVQ